MTQDGPITPVLLSGGEGSRLWPLSRRSHPKQFVGIGGPLTLFQQAALRFAPGEDGLFAPPVVMTGADFRFMARDQLECAGIAPEAVLIEPVPRNTAPAILAAALLMEARDPGAVLLIAPADHAIPDPAGFRQAVARGLPALATGQIVAFGIAPDRPETGYGYIEAGPLLDNTSDPIAGPRRVLRFVEKPDAARAAEMVQEGRFLWNAGLFLARAADLVAAFRLHAPHCLGPVSAALAGARDDLGFLRLDPASFAAAPSISVDFAVMEKATNLALVPYVGAWSDLGDWNAIWRGQAQDDAGVACHGPAEAIGCRNSLLRAEAGGQVLVGIGLEDMIAVAMPDAVLVAPRARPGGAPCRRAAARPKRAAGRCRTTRLPALGLVRDAGSRPRVPGETDHGSAGGAAVAAKPQPPRRALGGGRRRGADHAGDANAGSRAGPVGLCADRHGAPAGKSRPRSRGADRGADRQLSRRGRYRAP